MTLKVLDEYYQTITTLSIYLQFLIPSIPYVHPHDTDSYHNLVSTTKVAFNNSLDDVLAHAFDPPQCSQNDIVNRVQTSVLKNAKGKPSNVLAFGYPRHVNSMVLSLTTEDWSLLLQRIGEGPMFHLLTCTSLFLDLGNDNLYQLAGTPIYELKSRVPARSKRPREDATEAKQSTRDDGKNSPINIDILRKRLFYGKPEKRCGTRRPGLHFGLPTLHVLNRVTPDEEGARVVAKYIFPRQHGLHNVFTFEKEKGAWCFRDYSSRDAEIATTAASSSPNPKVPRRVQQAIPWITQMIVRHRRVNYHALLKRICASKIIVENSVPLDPATILGLMSEAPYLQSQVPMRDISDVSMNPVEQTENTVSKPRFAEFMCSHREVSSFAIAVTTKIIPMAFWGSEHNYQQMMKQITNFVSCRRYETVTLHALCQNLKFPEIEWALANLHGGKTTHRSSSDIAKGRELVEEFLYWLFDSFLIPLLKTTFYCTESAAFRNQVLYFRQDDWKQLCQPLLDRLCTTTFDKLPKGITAGDGKLGYSRVRLLPKETGVRPIVNLGRKRGTKLSINQILQGAFQVLSYERDRQVILQGAAVTSHTDICMRLKAFKQRHTAPDGTLPKLYFVKVDVQACFDTIEQGKLLEIIERVVKEDVYLLQRYTRLVPNAGSIKKQFCYSAVPEDESLPFLTVASELAASMRHAVFTDQVNYPHTERERLLALLKEHITSNVVKIGSDLYKQRIGIPQGSVLSTILCNVFYGDLEASANFRFTDDWSSLLLRYVDDYLFITTELDAARQFLNMMNKGHSEYGCFISREKTVTNFEHDQPTISPPCSREIVWCGLSIHLRSLNVTMDCSRFAQCNLADSLTIVKGRNPGTAFKHKVLKMARTRSHMIFTDPILNSNFTIYLNIYENFLFTAMKIVQYVIEWGVDVAKARAFLEDILRQAITYTYVSIKARASSAVARESVRECNMKRVEVLWLGFHAFEQVFSRKKAHFRPLFISVRKELHKPIYLGLKRGGKFDSVIRTGTEKFKGIAF